MSNDTYLYVVCRDELEWEDLIIFDNEDEAKGYSINHPQVRIELFKKDITSGYRPTYNYIKNGIIYFT